jgi:uncharacterized membrane protein YpjA
MSTLTDTLDDVVGDAADLPDRPDLPWYVQPVPRTVEDLGLRLAWLVVAVNVLGTAFGFWYYGFTPIPLDTPTITGQFALEPVVMWPLVPDSPMATLFIALAIGSWKLGRANEYFGALAFFGCLKLGAWTPYTLAIFKADFAFQHWAMYNFLFWSHLAMVLEGFVLYRIYDFRVRAVAVAAGWYLLNDLVDYFVPIVGDPHHTLMPSEYVNGVYDHSLAAHDLTAAGAVTLTVLAVFLTLATNVAKRRAGALE